MPDVSFSNRAYAKIILHAAKYPHCAINGLLLAKQKSKSDSGLLELRIEDAIPLFHVCPHVSPMAEIALILADEVAATKGLVLAGYYLANENINDVSTERPAHRIADKIAENNGNAVMVVVDNREVTFGMDSNPLRVSHFIDGKWKSRDQTNVMYDTAKARGNIIHSLLKSEHYRTLIDFDNHLDDVSLNWENKTLNKIIDELTEKH